MPKEGALHEPGEVRVWSSDMPNGEYAAYMRSRRGVKPDVVLASAWAVGLRSCSSVSMLHDHLTMMLAVEGLTEKDRQELQNIAGEVEDALVGRDVAKAELYAGSMGGS